MKPRQTKAIALDRREIKTWNIITLILILLTAILVVNRSDAQQNNSPVPSVPKQEVSVDHKSAKLTSDDVFRSFTKRIGDRLVMVATV